MTTKALAAAIENASSLDDLKKLVAAAKTVEIEKIVQEDGTIRGLYYCAASGRRGAILQVSIQNGLRTSMIVDGKDFRTVYREMVNAIVASLGLSEGHELIAKMHMSADAFLKVNNLQLTEIRYEQVNKVILETR